MLKKALLILLLLPFKGNCQIDNSKVEFRSHFGLNFNTFSYSYDAELTFLKQQIGVKYLVLGHLNEYFAFTNYDQNNISTVPIVTLQPRKSVFLCVFKRVKYESFHVDFGFTGNHNSTSAYNENLRATTDYSSALGLFSSLSYNRFCLDVLVPYYFEWKFFSPKVRATLLLFKD